MLWTKEKEQVGSRRIEGIYTQEQCSRVGLVIVFSLIDQNKREITNFSGVLYTIIHEGNLVKSASFKREKAGLCNDTKAKRLCCS